MADVKQVIKDLQGNFSGSNADQMKAVQLLKGLATSDEPIYMEPGGWRNSRVPAWKSSVLVCHPRGKVNDAGSSPRHFIKG